MFSGKTKTDILLKDIAEYFIGLTYKPENVSKDGIIVLRSGNIQESTLDFKDVVRVNMDVKKELYVKKNDILMCSRNGSSRLVGKVAMISNISEPMTFGTFMTIIRSPYYWFLWSFFQTDDFRKQVKGGKTMSINQITTTMLDEIVVPLPDEDLIMVYNSYVESIDKLKFDVNNNG